MTAVNPPSILARRRHKLGAAIFIVAVLQASLLFGGASTRSVGWLLLLTAIALLLAPSPFRTSGRIIVLIVAALFLAWTGVSLFQLLASTPSLRIPIVEQAGAVLGEVSNSPLTLNAGRFIDAFLRAALTAGALTCGVIFGENRNFAYRYLHWFVGGGLLICLATMLLFVVEPQKLLWLPKTAYLGDYTAAFVNRGAAGAWLSLVAITSFLLLVRLLRAGNEPDGYETDDSALRALLWRIGEAPVRVSFLALGFAVPLMGLFMTRSRAALLMVAAQGLLALLLVSASSAHSRRAFGLLIGAVAIALVIYNVGGQAISDRVAKNGFFDDGRWQIWTGTAEGIGQRPLLGYGAGTFRNGFPLFRPDALADQKEVQGAHSLPLELAFESGIPVSILICAGWAAACLLLLATCVRDVRQFDAIRIGALCAALGGGAVLAIDVTSESFGYVLPMLGLVGIGLAQLTYQPAARRLAQT